MRTVLAIVQAASFIFTVWALGLAYASFDGKLQVLQHHEWLLGGVALGITFAMRGYQMWKWSLPGPRIGSLVLGVGHLGLGAGYLIYEEMRRAGQGSGILLILPALWCIGTYLPGVIAIVVSFLQVFKHAKFAAHAA